MFIGIVATTFLVSFVVLLLASIRRYRNGVHNDQALPPGPRPLPLLGNLLGVPHNKEWETLAKWRDEYGDLVHIRVFGRSIIYVNTAEAAADLFSKRSTIYSDRPEFPLLNDLVGMTWNFGFMHYGDKWRTYRRVFSKKFGPSGVQGFCGIQEKSAKSLLQKIHHSPDEFLSHLRLHVIHTIVKVTYGFDVHSIDDYYVRNAEDVMRIVSDVASPGAQLVDSLPFIKYIPGWIPFASIQKRSQDWRKIVHDHLWSLYNTVKAKMTDPNNEERDLVENPDPSVEDWETAVRECAAVAYGGGFDTVLASLRAFLIAIASNPDVQKRAQTELDNVVGTNRLPKFSDANSLPYLTAVVKETLRWHSVAPQAIPHCLKQDDTYKEYKLPAGSIIVGNVWAITHDPGYYPDPFSFKPERYFINGKLDLSSNDPTKFAFGFGRRVCPGIHFANNMMWITAAYLLSTFKFEPIRDALGNEIPITLNARPGAISDPAPFKCSITPRRKDTESLFN